MEQELWQGLNLLNSEGPGVLGHWRAGGCQRIPHRRQGAPLKVWLTPGPFAGMPEPCPCSLLWFWEGPGVGLSHVLLQQGFPHPCSAGSGWAAPAWPLLAAESPAAPRRVRAGTAGTAPAGLCRSCPSLCCSSRCHETSSRAVFVFK